MSKKSRPSKYPKGTVTIKLTSKRSVHLTPKLLTIVFCVLLVAYVFGVPIGDVMYKLAMYLESSFIGQASDAEVQQTLFFLSFIPIVLFSAGLAYGTNYLAKSSPKYAHVAPVGVAGAMVIAGASLVIFFFLSFVCGFYYHFVW